MVLAYLRHAPLREGWVYALPRGHSPPGYPLRSLRDRGASAFGEEEDGDGPRRQLIKLDQPTVNSKFVSTKSSNGKA